MISEERVSPYSEGAGNKSINLFSAINQALHIALETDSRYACIVSCHRAQY